MLELSNTGTFIYGLSICTTELFSTGVFGIPREGCDENGRVTLYINSRRILRDKVVQVVHTSEGVNGESMNRRIRLLRRKGNEKMHKEKSANNSEEVE